MRSETTYPADYLSTLSTRELQEIMRKTRSLPLSSLINHQTFAADFENSRVWRDSYWKGSFAKDTPMGWEERLLTPIKADGSAYAGGRFWKRFDDIRDGKAFGHIVNYGMALLPGKPVVQQVQYPDDQRRYAQAGDDVLVLTYRNQPYRIVYDLIKTIDANNCIGVMHLGKFPRGLVFATFVMARNNYPFEKMAVPDHDAIFGDSRARVPDEITLAGSWKGSVVFLRHPELALHNQFNPPLLRMRFDAGTATIKSLVMPGRTHVKRIRRDADCVRLTDGSQLTEEIRQIDSDTLIGRRMRSGQPVSRYVLTRLDRGGIDS
jgi:hypothetical protein